mmetsp:Transcript_157814/g.294341  ORF Transcript_157814/g.294341 Transcript_157814/m.294341 type:complete len:680 (-) Transcript_157814:7-2046(-)
MLSGMANVALVLTCLASVSRGLRKQPLIEQLPGDARSIWQSQRQMSDTGMLNPTRALATLLVASTFAPAFNPSKAAHFSIRTHGGPEHVAHTIGKPRHAISQSNFGYRDPFIQMSDSPAEGDVSSLTVEDLNSQTVKDLKTKLRTLGLKTSGSKSKLIQRLEEHAAQREVPDREVKLSEVQGVPALPSKYSDVEVDVQELPDNVKHSENSEVRSNPAVFESKVSSPRQMARDQFPNYKAGKTSGYSRIFSGSKSDSIDEDVVEQLLMKRHEARMKQEWALADNFRKQLNEKGVTVDDTERIWIFNGDCLSYKQKLKTFSSVTEEKSGYRAPNITSIDKRHVERLLVQRMEAKRIQNFELADRIRDDLDAMGVTVSDKNKFWYHRSENTVQKKPLQKEHSPIQFQKKSLQTKQSPIGSGAKHGNTSSMDFKHLFRKQDAENSSEPFTRAVDCEANLSGAEVREIEALVAQRLQKKLDKSWDEANTLLDKLEARGVRVQDKGRVWRADSHPFVFPYTCGGGGRNRTTYGHTESEVSQAAALVHRRNVANVREQFTLAAQIKDELLSLGVNVNDDHRKWMFAYSRCPPPKDEYVLTDWQIQHVNKVLGQRHAARIAKRYDEADALQTYLREHLGVHNDEASHQWRVKEHALLKNATLKAAEEWRVRYRRLLKKATLQAGEDA